MAENSWESWSSGAVPSFLEDLGPSSADSSPAILDKKNDMHALHTPKVRDMNEARIETTTTVLGEPRTTMSWIVSWGIIKKEANNPTNANGLDHLGRERRPEALRVKEVGLEDQKHVQVANGQHHSGGHHDMILGVPHLDVVRVLRQDGKEDDVPQGKQVEEAGNDQK